MSLFPDDRHLPRSADGSEPILGGSIGLNRILLMLRAQAPMSNRTPWSAVLFNAFTIFRNIYTKGLPAAELTKRFRMDIDLFRVYLDAYLTTFGPPMATIPLVIYVPNYEYLPKELLRTPSPTNADILEQFTRFVRNFPAGETMQGASEATALWVVTVGNRSLLPHIQLAHWLQTSALASPKFGYRYGLPVMLISHCPIDLHITRRLPQTLLVESYQGIIRPQREFGRKLSTPSEAIPFTSVTHQVFGDPMHLKPLTDRDERKTLLEMATAHKWMQLPAEAVMRDIHSVTNMSISNLNKLRM